MGRTYYYFAASLPMVHWNGKLPLPIGEFIETAKRLLSGEDAALIEGLLTDREDIVTDNDIAARWIRFNRNFRNEIAAFRAKRAGKDPKKSIHGFQEDEPQLRGYVQEVGKMDNLLDAQKLLDRISWQLLDDLAIGHYYDLEFLICYGLKLRILQRQHVYASSVGEEVFESIRTLELPIEWTAQGI